MKEDVLPDIFPQIFVIKLFIRSLARLIGTKHLGNGEGYRPITKEEDGKITIRL